MRACIQSRQFSQSRIIGGKDQFSRRSDRLVGLVKPGPCGPECNRYVLAGVAEAALQGRRSEAGVEIPRDDAGLEGKADVFENARGVGAAGEQGAGGQVV